MEKTNTFSSEDDMTRNNLNAAALTVSTNDKVVQIKRDIQMTTFYNWIYHTSSGCADPKS
ncbi:hypothetical protein AC1031_014945 [Aphanomyces cochlioides]|nr:hypothetical protein AC1031_014945 [Aphanomyces cochlioides]